MIGHNGINDTEAKRWMGEVHRVYDELDAQKIENMNRCKSIRERLPDIYKSAKAAGMSVKAIKAAVKVQRAEKALDHLIDKITPEDEDDAEAFEYFRAIPKQGDLFASAGNDDERDLRPGFLKNSARGLPGADAAEA